MFNKTLKRETTLPTQNNRMYYDKKEINGTTDQHLEQCFSFHITAYKNLQYEILVSYSIINACSVV